MYARISGGSGRSEKSDCWCSLSSVTPSRSAPGPPAPPWASRAASRRGGCRTAPAPARPPRPGTAGLRRRRGRTWCAPGRRTAGRAARRSTPGASVSNRKMSWSVPSCTKHSRARKACIASASRSTANRSLAARERWTACLGRAERSVDDIVWELARREAKRAVVFYSARSLGCRPPWTSRCTPGEEPARPHGQGHRRLRPRSTRATASWSASRAARTRTPCSTCCACCSGARRCGSSCWR